MGWFCSLVHTHSAFEKMNCRTINDTLASVHLLFSSSSFHLLCLGNDKEKIGNNEQVFNSILVLFVLLSNLCDGEDLLLVPSWDWNLTTKNDLGSILPKKEVEGLVFKKVLEILVREPILNLLILRSIFLGNFLFGSSCLWIEDHFDSPIENVWEVESEILFSQLIEVISFDEVLQGPFDLLYDRFRAYHEISGIARLFRFLASPSDHLSHQKGLMHFIDRLIKYRQCLRRIMRYHPITLMKAHYLGSHHCFNC